MARRSYAPYNSSRFLCSGKTQEIHDLDRETLKCMIDFILKTDVTMLETAKQVDEHVESRGYKGCAFCMPERIK